MHIRGRHAGRPSARSLRLVAGAVGATSAAATPLFLLGALAVQVRAELDFDEIGLGAAVAVFFTASALTGPVMVRVIERIGAFAGVMVTCGLGATALAGIAGVATSWTGLAAAMALAGVAQAFGQPAANGLLSRGLAAGRQGLAFGLKQMAVPLTSLAAGAAVPLVALTIGWRWAFALAAVALLAVPVLVPRRDASAAPVRGRRRAPLSPALLWLAVGGALASAPTMALGTFLVETAVAAGIAESTAGVLLACGGATAVTVRLAVGWHADRSGIDPLRTIVVMMLLGAPAIAALGLLGSPLAMALAVAVAFGAGWGWNGLLDLAVVRLNRDSPAAATGVLLIGFFCGAAVGPLGFGALAAQLGFGAAWLAGAMVLLAAAGCVTAARAARHGASMTSAATAVPEGDPQPA